MSPSRDSEGDDPNTQSMCSEVVQGERVQFGP